MVKITKIHDVRTNNINSSIAADAPDFNRVWRGWGLWWLKAKIWISQKEFGIENI